MNEDAAVLEIQRKIQREQDLITAAQRVRQATTNAQVIGQAESQIRDARRNIQYFEDTLQDLYARKMGADMNRMSLSSNGAVPPPAPPQRGGPGGTNDLQGYGRGDYSGAAQAQYGMGGPQPQRQTYSSNSGPIAPRARPNFSRLDLIKYDTAHLGPRIQLMLSQLQFKLSVEQQYKEGIEKMLRLYQMDGDRKSRADAEGRRVESNQKIQLLTRALRRYEDLHIAVENGADANDDESLDTSSQRKPLSGHMSVRIQAVADVEHAAAGRFSRGPETFVIMKMDKVDDSFKGRTKATRNDRWTEEVHEFDVDKANEIEFIVYDKSGDHPVPIGLLWIRLSDLVDEIRRKRLETEFNQAGWISADKMDGSGAPRPDLHFNPPPNAQNAYGAPPSTAAASGGPPGSGLAPQTGPIFVDAWFSLEPVGRIHLTLGFVKQTKDRRPFDVGLNRKGAVRQKKEDIDEQYGHKFASQTFYNIMRCAYCGDFLKNAAGKQCTDCKLTCHKACYQNIVTKCISKSNAETDPEEETIKHRIPHRFDAFANMGANWCCHCGYVLPLGRRQSRRCTECKITCHTGCAHLVPDFCGMSMEAASRIMKELRNNKVRNTRFGEGKATRPPRPTPAPAAQSYPSTTSHQDQFSKTNSEGRLSYGNRTSEQYEQSPRGQPYSDTLAGDAARVSMKPPSTPPETATRPSAHDRSSSSLSAANAANAAINNANRASQSTTSPPYRPSASSPGPSSPDRGGSGYADGFAESGGPRTQQQAHQPYDPQEWATFMPTAGWQQQQSAPGRQAMPPPPPPKSTPYGQTSQVVSPPPHGQQQVASPQRPTAQTQPPTNITAPVVEERKAAPPANSSGTGRRIGLDHFNFLAVLGKGNFGKVMLAETKTTKQLYAIKVLKKEFIIENDEVESVRSEKRVFLIANKERHPFLLNLHACFQTETRVYFVMEYISGGDLMLHIQRGQFGMKRAQFYAAEVCLALKYFHENGVVYRDLKLDNIMLTLDGHIKVADYGLCKEDMWYNSTTSTFCGTPEFMAPEILLDKKYGRAVDWWAFGVLIYQMLLQQSPFRGEDEDEIYDAILADEPLYPIHMPRDSVSILQKLLTREPELRLGSGVTDAQEIMSHAFFRNINWEDIYFKRVQPPFLPTVKSRADTSNFDSEFTSVTPVLTPVQSVLTQAMQEEFRGFSYSADFA